jgi:xanthine dehydrogenase accessory factor
MNDDLLEELLRARAARVPCVLATVAATSGSVPRAAGSKMLIYYDGKISGTIGGGKFEALVIEEALGTIGKEPVLKRYPLREGETDSFGAICGGEVTVLLEPQRLSEAIYLVGGGHCSRAIAKLAIESGFAVSVIEDRAELMADWPAAAGRVTEKTAPEFIAAHSWRKDEALVIVSRNHEIDREALAAATQHAANAGYIGMIGSQRKVRMVFEDLRGRGVGEEILGRVHAPLGLDIGADSPAEIAISALAEIIAVLRGREAVSLRRRLRTKP